MNKNRLLSVAAAGIVASLSAGVANATVGCYEPLNEKDWHDGMYTLMKQLGSSDLVRSAGLSSESIVIECPSELNGECVRFGPRLVYRVQGNGNLTTKTSREQFGHGYQKVYDTNGKVTNFPFPFAVEGFTGSAIVQTASKSLNPNGARLTGEISAFQIYENGGIPTQNCTNGNCGGPSLSIPMELDCSSYQTSNRPDEWHCTFTAAIFGFDVTLVKSNVNKDPNCSVFSLGNDRIPD